MIEDFWLNYKEVLLMIALLPLGIAWLSLNFYTGSVKKLDLIIKDIKLTGKVSQRTLKYDKFFNNTGQGIIDSTFLTHLIFFIPKRKSNENLYKNKTFIDQLMIIKIYRWFYKIVLINFIVIFSFLVLMWNLYGR